MKPLDRQSKKWLWMTLALTAVIILAIQVPLLLDPEYVDEDLRFFYWLHRLSDASLFENDPLLGYQFFEVDLGSRSLLFNRVTLVYGALYALFGQVMSPFIFSKILAIPLALVASYNVFRITNHLLKPTIACLVALVVTLIMVLPYSEISLHSALPRAFTLPLLLFALCTMMTNNLPGLAIALVLAMVYPPIFLILLLAYGLRFIMESLRKGKPALTRRQGALLGLAVLLSLALLLPAALTSFNAVPASANGSQQEAMFASPWYGKDGRYALLGSVPLASNGGAFDSGLIGFESMFLAPFLALIAAVLRRRFVMLPAAFHYLLAASLIGFVLSWAAILLTPSASLHLPSRYLRGTTFIVFVFLFVLNAPAALQALSTQVTGNPTARYWLVAAAGLVGLTAMIRSSASLAVGSVTAALVLLALVLLFIIRRRATGGAAGDATAPGESQRSKGLSLEALTLISLALLILPLLVYLQWPSKNYRPGPDQAELVAFARSVPKDAIFSGYPCLLDDIPLFAQRAVLFSCEIENREMSVMNDVFEAYFAESPGEVWRFCQKYDVDYLVGSPITFSVGYRQREKIIFEPFNSYLKQLLNGRTEFALSAIPDDDMVFQNGTYFVVPCTAVAAR